MLVGVGGSGTSPIDPPAPKPSAKAAPPTASATYSKHSDARGSSATASASSNATAAPSAATPADPTFGEICSIAAAKTAAAQAHAKAAQARAKAAAAGLQRDLAQAKQDITRYARTASGQSTAPPSGAELSAKSRAEKSSFNLLMDYYLVKQGVREPTHSVYADSEQALLHDPRTLARIEAQFEQSEKGAGLSVSDLQVLARGGEVAAGEQLLPKSQQTTSAIQAYGAAVKNRRMSLISASTALQRAGFLEEVMTYERANGLGLATPYSPQWSKNALRLLSNPLSARDTVMMTHAKELSANGLDAPTFYAQLWASEVVGKALLQQKQGGDDTGTGKAVGTIAAAFHDPNGSRPNSTALDSVTIGDNALDPILARQALKANSYVKGLPRQIAGIMERYAGRSGHSQADAIQWLSEITKSASVDPQLATEIVKESKQTLQADLKGQTAAPTDQAAQAYLAAAEIYFVMQKAAAAGTSDAGTLAKDIAQSSFNAVSATSDTSYFNSHTGIGTQGQLDAVLGAIVTQAHQVPGNLFKAWRQLVGSHSGPLASVAWGAFQSVLTDAPLVLRSVTSTVERSAPTVSDAEQALQAKMGLGESLRRAISATRAQMAVDYGPGPGNTNELRLAEAALALAGESNLQAYFQDPSEATDPIAVASSQIAALDAFDPAVLRRATAIMTATKSPNLAALGADAARAQATRRRWQTDAAANKPAAVIGQDEQAYHAALLAELNDASGETRNAWLGDPVNADRLWKAQYVVAQTNLAPLRQSGNQQAVQIASAQLQTSLQAVSILADVSTAQQASRDDALAAQELTGDLNGLSPSNPLYQEVMDDGSMRALLASAQADVTQAANARLQGASKLMPETRLANTAKVLAEYQGTVLYAPLLHATEQAPVTQQLFDAVAHRPLTERGNGGDALTEIASVLNGLQADPDLAAALYQGKFANSVRFWISHYPSRGDEQTYYAALGQIYVDVGGANSAQGAALRHAVEARISGDDPVATPTMTGEGGRAGALDPGAEHVVLTYDLGNVKAAGQPMQLYQDVIDETPARAATKEIESETGFRRSGHVPTPINRPGTDPVGLAGVDGLSALTTKAELINELGQAEKLTPAHLPQTAAEQTALSEGQYAEYDLRQTVYGNTTLGDLLNSTLASAGVTQVSAQTPVVLTALPLEFTSATGQSRALSLLEIDGGSGQARYVGPANVTRRGSFSNWIEYNGFSKGELFANAHLVFGSNAKILRGPAYSISNQTGITTWDKVWTYTQIGLTAAAGLVTTFVDPATAPLWLAVASELADAWVAYQSYQGITQSVQTLSTAQGRGDWVNWFNLGANLFGEAAAAEGVASRSASIMSRLGIEDDTFAAAWNLRKVVAGKDVLEAERGMASADGPRPTLVFAGESRLKRILQAGVLRAPRPVTKLMWVDKIAAAPMVTGPAGNVARLRTLLQSGTQVHLTPLLFRGVGGAAMVTNLGSMGIQLAEMKERGATPSALLQLAVSAGLTGLGFGVARAHGQSTSASTEVVWAEPDPDGSSKYTYRTLRQASNGRWVPDTGPLRINGDPPKYRLVFVRSPTDDGQTLVMGRLSKLQSDGSYREVYSKGMVWSESGRLPDDGPPAHSLEATPDGRQASDADEKIPGSRTAGGSPPGGAGHRGDQLPADGASRLAAFEVPPVVKVGANDGSVAAVGADATDASTSPPRIAPWSQPARGVNDASTTTPSGPVQPWADLRGAVGSPSVPAILTVATSPTVFDPARALQDDAFTNSLDGRPSDLIADPPMGDPQGQLHASSGRAGPALLGTASTGENAGAADPSAYLASPTTGVAQTAAAAGRSDTGDSTRIAARPASISTPLAPGMVETAGPSLAGNRPQTSAGQAALKPGTADAGMVRSAAANDPAPDLAPLATEAMQTASLTLAGSPALAAPADPPLIGPSEQPPAGRFLARGSAVPRAGLHSSSLPSTARGRRAEIVSREGGAAGFADDDRGPQSSAQQDSGLRWERARPALHDTVAGDIPQNQPKGAEPQTAGASRLAAAMQAWRYNASPPDTDLVAPDSTNGGSTGAHGEPAYEVDPLLELKGARYSKQLTGIGLDGEGLVVAGRPASAEIRLPQSLTTFGRILDGSNRYYAGFPDFRNIFESFKKLFKAGRRSESARPEWPGIGGGSGSGSWPTDALQVPQYSNTFIDRFNVERLALVYGIRARAAKSPHVPRRIARQLIGALVDYPEETITPMGISYSGEELARQHVSSFVHSKQPGELVERLLNQLVNEPLSGFGWRLKLDSPGETNVNSEGRTRLVVGITDRDAQPGEVFVELDRTSEHPSILAFPDDSFDQIYFRHNFNDALAIEASRIVRSYGWLAVDVNPSIGQFFQVDYIVAALELAGFDLVKIDHSFFVDGYYRIRAYRGEKRALSQDPPLAEAAASANDDTIELGIDWGLGNPEPEPGAYRDAFDKRRQEIAWYLLEGTLRAERGFASREATERLAAIVRDYSLERTPIDVALDLHDENPRDPVEELAKRHVIDFVLSRGPDAVVESLLKQFASEFISGGPPLLSNDTNRTNVDSAGGRTLVVGIVDWNSAEAQPGMILVSNDREMAFDADYAARPHVLSDAWYMSFGSNTLERIHFSIEYNLAGSFRGARSYGNQDPTHRPMIDEAARVLRPGGVVLIDLATRREDVPAAVERVRAAGFADVHVEASFWLRPRSASGWEPNVPWNIARFRTHRIIGRLPDAEPVGMAQDPSTTPSATPVDGSSLRDGRNGRSQGDAGEAEDPAAPPHFPVAEGRPGQAPTRGLSAGSAVALPQDALRGSGDQGMTLASVPGVAHAAAPGPTASAALVEQLVSVWNRALQTPFALAPRGTGAEISEQGNSSFRDEQPASTRSNPAADDMRLRPPKGAETRTFGTTLATAAEESHSPDNTDQPVIDAGLFVLGSTNAGLIGARRDAVDEADLADESNSRGVSVRALAAHADRSLRARPDNSLRDAYARAGRGPGGPAGRGPRRSTRPEDPKGTAEPASGAGRGNVRPPPPPFRPWRGEGDSPGDLPYELEAFRKWYDNKRRDIAEYVHRAVMSPFVTFTAAEEALFLAVDHYLDEYLTDTPIDEMMELYTARYISDMAVEDLAKVHVEGVVNELMHNANQSSDVVDQALFSLDQYLTEYVSGGPPVLHSDVGAGGVNDQNSVGGNRLVVRSVDAWDFEAPGQPGELVIEPPEDSRLNQIPRNSFNEVYLKNLGVEWTKCVKIGAKILRPRGRIIIDNWSTPDEVNRAKASLVAAGFEDVRAEQLTITRPRGGTSQRVAPRDLVSYRLIGFLPESAGPVAQEAPGPLLESPREGTEAFRRLFDSLRRDIADYVRGGASSDWARPNAGGNLYAAIYDYPEQRSSLDLMRRLYTMRDGNLISVEDLAKEVVRRDVTARLRDQIADDQDELSLLEQLLSEYVSGAPPRIGRDIAAGDLPRIPLDLGSSAADSANSVNGNRLVLRHSRALDFRTPARSGEVIFEKDRVEPDDFPRFFDLLRVRPSGDIYRFNEVHIKHFGYPPEVVLLVKQYLARPGGRIIIDNWSTSDEVDRAKAILTAAGFEQVRAERLGVGNGDVVLYRVVGFVAESGGAIGAEPSPLPDTDRGGVAAASVNTPQEEERDEQPPHAYGESPPGDADERNGHALLQARGGPVRAISRDPRAPSRAGTHGTRGEATPGPEVPDPKWSSARGAPPMPPGGHQQVTASGAEDPRAGFLRRLIIEQRRIVRRMREAAATSRAAPAVVRVVIDRLSEYDPALSVSRATDLAIRRPREPAGETISLLAKQEVEQWIGPLPLHREVLSGWPPSGTSSQEVFALVSQLLEQVLPPPPSRPRPIYDPEERLLAYVERHAGRDQVAGAVKNMLTGYRIHLRAEYDRGPGTLNVGPGQQITEAYSHFEPWISGYDQNSRDPLLVAARQRILGILEDVKIEFLRQVAFEEMRKEFGGQQTITERRPGTETQRMIRFPFPEQMRSYLADSEPWTEVLPLDPMEAAIADVKQFIDWRQPSRSMLERVDAIVERVRHEMSLAGGGEEASLAARHLHPDALQLIRSRSSNDRDRIEALLRRDEVAAAAKYLNQYYALLASTQGDAAASADDPRGASQAAARARFNALIEQLQVDEAHDVAYRALQLELANRIGSVGERYRTAVGRGTRHWNQDLPVDPLDAAIEDLWGFVRLDASSLSSALDDAIHTIVSQLRTERAAREVRETSAHGALPPEKLAPDTPIELLMAYQSLAARHASMQAETAAIRIFRDAFDQARQRISFAIWDRAGQGGDVRLQRLLSVYYRDNALAPTLFDRAEQWRARSSNPVQAAESAVNEWLLSQDPPLPDVSKALLGRVLGSDRWLETISAPAASPNRDDYVDFADFYHAFNQARRGFASEIAGVIGEEKSKLSPPLRSRMQRSEIEHLSASMDQLASLMDSYREPEINVRSLRMWAERFADPVAAARLDVMRHVQDLDADLLRFVLPVLEPRLVSVSGLRDPLGGREEKVVARVLAQHWSDVAPLLDESEGLDGGPREDRSVVRADEYLRERSSRGPGTSIPEPRFVLTRNDRGDDFLLPQSAAPNALVETAGDGTLVPATVGEDRELVAEFVDESGFVPNAYVIVGDEGGGQKPDAQFWLFTDHRGLWSLKPIGR